MIKYFVFFLCMGVVFSCETEVKDPQNIKVVSNPKDTMVSNLPKAQWRNPVMSPMGADISRVVRGYFLVGDYTKMLQFVIIPPCYEKKQIEYILRKSKWGYTIRMTNLQWMEDSTFILTYLTTKEGTTGSEQYVGRIWNDTAKIFLFPEKENLFQYYGDEDLNDPCKLKNAMDRIFFEYDKSVILDKSRPALKAILAYLMSNPQLNAHFVGHASNDGSSEHNLLLSQQRAQAICNYLISQGISKDRLTSEGRGDKFPIAPNTSESNKAKNRRVEMIISEVVG